MDPWTHLFGPERYTNSQGEYCDGCLKINRQAPGSPQALACKCYEVVQTGGPSAAKSFNFSLIGTPAQPDNFLVYSRANC